MTVFPDYIFIDEIVLQTKIAKKAAERLRQLEETGYDRIDVWGSIQLLLVATGNVSKILWPVRNKNKPRGKRLREFLNVNENSILANRQFRNNFEHYDERIEEMFANKSSINYSDLSMNPSLQLFGENHHRGYNSFNNTLLFHGELLDINEVMNALEDLLRTCQPYTLI